MRHLILGCVAMLVPWQVQAQVVEVCAEFESADVALEVLTMCALEGDCAIGLFSEPDAAAGGGGTANDDLDTPADTIHPNIHQNNNAGQNANPNGNDGGGNMHGIGNVPGQNGTHPGDDGVPGFANQIDTVHGGMSTVNRNAE